MTVGLNEAARTLELLASHCHSAIAGGGHGVVKLSVVKLSKTRSCACYQTFEKCI